MNLLQTITAHREKLDAKVNAAIAERDAFIASIGDAVGQVKPPNRRGKRTVTAAQRKKLSQAKKRYWAEKKEAAKK